MQTYELLVHERTVRAASADTTLVRTSVGVDQVHVLFDHDEWLDFPVTVTFAMGDVMRTVPVTVSRLADSEEWAAESTARVPYEVVRSVGPLRVTFQGTDSEGNHIITAKGSPLSVEEAGDVTLGEIPGDAPTVNEWQSAYSDAQRAINEAQSLVSGLQSRLDSLVAGAERSLDETISDAESALADLVESFRPIASEEALGMVMVGDGLSITSDGTLSSTGLTPAQRTALVNLVSLARSLTGADVGSSVPSSPKVERDALPIASVTQLGALMADGTTIRVDADGMAHAYVGKADVATYDAAGTVRPDGTTITLDEDGTIHGNASYTLPMATAYRLGGVKVPSRYGLSVSGGEISVSPANTYNYGTVRVDGTTITSSNGTISAKQYTLPAASATGLGGVKVDGTTITADEDGTIHGATTYVLPIATDGEAVEGVDDDKAMTAAKVAAAIEARPRLEVREDQYGTKRLAIVIPED